GHKTESVFKGYSGHALETDLNDVTLFQRRVHHKKFYSFVGEPFLYFPNCGFRPGCFFFA
ncbi:hypothetical protein, partial [Treponema sp. R80B11-R83G3]